MSTVRKPALLVLPLLLAGSGVAVLVSGAAPASAAPRRPALQICLLKTACVTAGQAPSAVPSATPLIAVTIGGGSTPAPVLPSVSVAASLPVVLPSATLPVATPSIGVVVDPTTVPASSAAAHDAVDPQNTPTAPTEGDATPSVVASFGTVNGAASASVSARPLAAAAVPRTPSSRIPGVASTVPAANSHALQAIAPAVVRPVVVSPKLIQHVVSHSVGGVLLLLAACLVFIGIEISADRRDPKLLRAAQKSEWLRFEDPSKTAGGVA